MCLRTGELNRFQPVVQAEFLPLVAGQSESEKECYSDTAENERLGPRHEKRAGECKLSSPVEQDEELTSGGRPER